MYIINKLFLLAFFFATSVNFLFAQKKNSDFSLLSPDSNIELEVNLSEDITWSVVRNSLSVILPSSIAMTLEGGEILGDRPVLIDFNKEEISSSIKAVNYKKNIIKDQYNELTLKFENGFGIIFRAYNSGVAYRFFTFRDEKITIESEEANFNFSADHKIFIPYANNPDNDIYQISFENIYQHIYLSEVDKDTLGFAPVLVDFKEGLKVGITEADLESYPGMFLKADSRKYSLKGEFAPYPLQEIQGGYNDLQSVVVKRADYIAKTDGTRKFPWRLVIMSEEDKELLNNDMVYQLAAPSRIEDITWIQPGKVAWDWWNDWNISKVNFQAGINTETYKYYIDFAGEYDIENILLDEGWTSNNDIMAIVPEIDLIEIIKYADKKGIGVWLWGGYLPLAEKMDEALSFYSQMGIKGFKVDFMDRDDQKMVDFCYDIAEKAAQHHLMLDFHGTYKPTGLQRTYPNVMNFEGVRGLEYVKWSETDFPLYDTTIPFIRMLAGPMDYTPGAMKNANKENFSPIFSAPMSQGTRVHQLALYILFESPFNMLADNPTNYIQESESTKFISSIPTVFDETVAVDGKIGEFAAIARRHDDTWYLGAITNWDARDLSLDLSFLPEGNFEAVIFKDGMNADREASDYIREVIEISSADQLDIHLSPGGGWAARIYLMEKK